MLNKNIKMLREENNLTQKEFADAMGFTRPYVAQMEGNDDYNPAIGFVAKMAAYFGVSIDYLYTGKDYSSVDDLKNKLNKVEQALEEVRQAIPDF